MKVAGLPGRLALPPGDGPFPAVVLVHGSGPNDEDETIGARKLFRDLAWGLAARNIATLRYVKRSRFQPEAFDPKRKATVKEEVIDDARAAVALLERDPRIARRAVFLLGHSLGGTLAPRIAQGGPPLAGLLIFAGSTRPLDELVRDQLRVIGAAVDAELVERTRPSPATTAIPSSRPTRSSTSSAPSCRAPTCATSAPTIRRAPPPASRCPS